MIGTVFADSLIEIASKTTGIKLFVINQEVEVNGKEDALFGVTGMMNLNGKDSGLVFISASERDMRAFCGRMLGEDPDALEHDDLSDGICELVNMTAGSAKLRLGSLGYSFTLSPPFAMESGNIKLVTKKRTSVISLVVGNDDFRFKIKIIWNANTL